MRNVLLLVALAVGISSCKKELHSTTPLPVDGLAGKWRMVAVTNNLLNTTTTKPTTITGNVDITFTFVTTNTGKIEGNTPTNLLNGGFTVNNSGAINIPAVMATKVAETTWGQLFLDNIVPPAQYRFEGGQLLITNFNNVTLKFKRL